eukprot:scaffold5682_cov229-Pinguiococcus_pyrenoidosus.AAC.2
MPTRTLTAVSAMLVFSSEAPRSVAMESNEESVSVNTADSVCASVWELSEESLSRSALRSARPRLRSVAEAERQGVANPSLLQLGRGLVRARSHADRVQPEEPAEELGVAGEGVCLFFVQLKGVVAAIHVLAAADPRQDGHQHFDRSWLRLVSRRDRGHEALEHLRPQPGLKHALREPARALVAYHVLDLLWLRERHKTVQRLERDVLVEEGIHDRLDQLRFLQNPFLARRLHAQQLDALGRIGGRLHVPHQQVEAKRAPCLLLRPPAAHLHQGCTGPGLERGHRGIREHHARGTRRLVRPRGGQQREKRVQVSAGHQGAPEARRRGSIPRHRAKPAKEQLGLLVGKLQDHLPVLRGHVGGWRRDVGARDAEVGNAIQRAARPGHAARAEAAAGRHRGLQQASWVHLRAVVLQQRLQDLQGQQDDELPLGGFIRRGERVCVREAELQHCVVDDHKQHAHLARLHHELANFVGVAVDQALQTLQRRLEQAADGALSLPGIAGLLRAAHEGLARLLEQTGDREDAALVDDVLCLLGVLHHLREDLQHPGRERHAVDAGVAEVLVHEEHLHHRGQDAAEVRRRIHRVGKHLDHGHGLQAEAHAPRVRAALPGLRDEEATHRAEAAVQLRRCRRHERRDVREAPQGDHHQQRIHKALRGFVQQRHDRRRRARVQRSPAPRLHGGARLGAIGAAEHLEKPQGGDLEAWLGIRPASRVEAAQSGGEDATAEQRAAELLVLVGERLHVGQLHAERADRGHPGHRVLPADHGHAPAERPQREQARLRDVLEPLTALRAEALVDLEGRRSDVGERADNGRLRQDGREDQSLDVGIRVRAQRVQHVRRRALRFGILGLQQRLGERQHSRLDGLQAELQLFRAVHREAPLPLQHLAQGQQGAVVQRQGGVLVRIGVGPRGGHVLVHQLLLQGVVDAIRRRQKRSLDGIAREAGHDVRRAGLERRLSRAQQRDDDVENASADDFLRSCHGPIRMRQKQSDDLQQITSKGRAPSRRRVGRQSLRGEGQRPLGLHRRQGLLLGGQQSQECGRDVHVPRRRAVHQRQRIADGVVRDHLAHEPLESGLRLLVGWPRPLQPGIVALKRSAGSCPLLRFLGVDEALQSGAEGMHGMRHHPLLVGANSEQRAQEEDAASFDEKHRATRIGVQEPPHGGGDPHLRLRVRIREEVKERDEAVVHFHEIPNSPVLDQEEQEPGRVLSGIRRRRWRRRQQLDLGEGETVIDWRGPSR